MTFNTKGLIDFAEIWQPLGITSSAHINVMESLKGNKTRKKKSHWNLCIYWWPNTIQCWNISRHRDDQINIKMTSYQYRKSYCGDKMILRPSYLHNGISYTCKMKSLYWIRALVPYTYTGPSLEVLMLMSTLQIILKVHTEQTAVSKPIKLSLRIYMIQYNKKNHVEHPTPTSQCCPCLSSWDLDYELINHLWNSPHGHWFLDFNTLRPRQDGRHFPNDIFKCIFLNENVWISISLKFVPKGPINNIPALVQIMAWRRPGDKPLFEPMMVSLLTHIWVTRPQWFKPSQPKDTINLPWNAILSYWQKLINIT